MTTPTIDHAVCPHDCPDSCGLVVQRRGNDILSVTGASSHPHTAGWLCAKLRDYGAWVDAPERLREPLQRIGPKGSMRWRSISWEQALDTIATRWGRTIERYGAAAILPYSYGGTLGLVQNSVASSRLWNRLGASALGRSICGEAGKEAVRATLGARWSPPIEQLLHSRLIVIWGHNPVTSAPHAMPWIQRAKRQGAKIVVIDPLRSRTARRADLHLAPYPGTDGALALGLVRELGRHGAVDYAYLGAHSIGWERLLETAEGFSIERTAALTGLRGAEITHLASLVASLRPAHFMIADGIQRHEKGGQAVRAIAALPAVLGQYGVMGGGLAYSTSDYLRWDEEAVGHAVQCPPVPRTVNMNRLGAALLGEVQDPPIQCLYVFAANPLTSAPHAAAISRGLLREDLFCVVHDLVMTDTARLADIVLPATSQLEHHDLHKAYGHTVLAYNAPCIAPRGGAMSNWDVMRRLAARLGYQESWLHDDAPSVIDEVLAATAQCDPALAGITRQRLEQQAFVPLKLPFEGPPFAEGIFPTPSGKIELFSQSLADLGVAPVASYAPELEHVLTEDGSLLLLSTAPHHFVNSTFASLAHLRAKEGCPTLWLHPQDAEARQLVAGHEVRIANERGSVILPLGVCEDVRRGVAWTTKGHWADSTPAGRSINWITSDRLGDLAGQSTFQSTRVIVTSAKADQD